MFLVAATQTTTHSVPHLIAHLDEWFDAHPEDRAKVSDREYIKRAAHDDALSHVIDAQPPDSERDAVEEAATLCPSRAIRY